MFPLFHVLPSTRKRTTTRERIVQAMEEIKEELAARRKVLLENNKLLEEQRLTQLIIKPQKTGGDFKEIDLLGRQIERLARVKKA